MTKAFQLAVLASLTAMTETLESGAVALASGQVRKMRAALAEVEKSIGPDVPAKKPRGAVGAFKTEADPPAEPKPLAPQGIFSLDGEREPQASEAAAPADA